MTRHSLNHELDLRVDLRAAPRTIIGGFRTGLQVTALQDAAGTLTHLGVARPVNTHGHYNLAFYPASLSSVQEHSHA